MTTEAEILCKKITGLYAQHVPLPAELEIAIFDWGIENYRLGGKYHLVRKLYDEIKAGHTPSDNGERLINDLLLTI